MKIIGQFVTKGNISLKTQTKTIFLVNLNRLFFSFTQFDITKILIALVLAVFLVCLVSIQEVIYAQKFSQTLELDWDGARPGGSCVLCDDDYACSNGFGEWNDGKRSFFDPIPDGMVLTNVTVKIQHACPGGDVEVKLNDQSIGIFGRKGIDCSCNSCFVSEVSSQDMSVLNTYNFEDNNTIQVKSDSVLICIDRAIVQLDYEVAKTVQTTVSQNNNFCPGSKFPVNFTSTGEYPSDNIYQVELSTPQGDFNNPIIIGQLSSTENSGTIMAYLPDNLIYSNTYRIRVIPTTPHLSVTDNQEDLKLGDNLAPVFNLCPPDIQIKTIPGDSTAQVYWATPSAMDNCSEVQLNSNFTPGQSFAIGMHSIDYQAVDASGNTSNCSFKITVIDGRPKVTGFVLVDADKNEDIVPIYDEGIINLLDFASNQKLSIRAVTDPDTTGSVFFKLNGAMKRFTLEDVVPYSLFGDFPHGNYKGFVLKTGDYQVEATPYTENRREGIEGFGSTLNFKVIREFRLSLFNDENSIITVSPSRNTFEPGSTVTIQAQPESDYRFLNWTNEKGEVISTSNPYSFQIQEHTKLRANFEPKIAIQKLILVDADTDQEIKIIQDKDTLSLEELPTTNLSIRAIADAQTVSVRFKLGDPFPTNRAENIEPYSLFGEDGLGNYIGKSFIPGKYTLETTPYYERAGRGEAGITSKISFTVVEKILPSVKKVNLIDTEKDIILLSIQDGDVINLDDFDTDLLSLEAVVDSDEIKSVAMNLKGALLATKEESILPFALFGDRLKRDFIGRAFPLGEYNLEIKPYSEAKLKGEEGNTLNLSFTITGTPKIKHLSLINTNTQEDISILSENDVISLDETGNSITFRADPMLTGSVFFTLKDENGQIIEEKIESHAPFALFGDTHDGLYIGWSPEVGKYTLSLTPYSQKKAQGMKGSEMIYNFEIIGETSVAQKSNNAFAEKSPENDLLTQKIKIFPNPATNELKILFEESTNGSVDLIIRDNQGNLVYQRKESFGLVSPLITIDLDKLSLKAGMYHITLKDASHTYVSKSFVKQ